MVAAFGALTLLVGTVMMIARRDPFWFMRLRRR
jgi:hypothetical protein